MNLDSGGVSRVVAQLERQGLIERHAVPSNRRILEIRLSRRGQTLLPKLEATTARVAADFLSGLTQSEQRTLLGLLARIPSVLST